MKFVLQLKHWQLFLMSIILPYLLKVMSSIYIGVNNNNNIEFFTNLLLIIVLFSWLWTMANKLSEISKKIKEQELWNFKIIFIISVLFLISLFWIITHGLIVEYSFILFMVPIYLFFMVKIMLFIAKNLKTAELNRDVDLNEYIVDAILIWFFPLGIWVIQPRINRLFKDF